MSARDAQTQLEHSKSLKQYARLLNPQPGHEGVLDVWDHENWVFMRRDPRPELICFSPACGKKMETVHRTSDRASGRGVRFLRYKAGDTCEHVHAAARVVTATPTRGGGEMTPEHSWLQRRILTVARRPELNLDVVLEDRESKTFADVLWRRKDRLDLAIEVQRWDTEFEKRQQMRREAGAATLWLFPISGTDAGIDVALQRYPSARFYLVPQDNPHGQLSVQPWDLDDENDRARREANRVGRLYVGATMARAARSGRMLRASFRESADRGGRELRIDLMQFLREIDQDRRAWFPAGCLPGLDRGAWMLRADAQRLRGQRTTRPDTPSRALQTPPRTAAVGRPAVTKPDDAHVEHIRQLRDASFPRPLSGRAVRARAAQVGAKPSVEVTEATRGRGAELITASTAQEPGAASTETPLSLPPISVAQSAPMTSSVNEPGGTEAQTDPVSAPRGNIEEVTPGSGHTESSETHQPQSGRTRQRPAGWVLTLRRFWARRGRRRFR